MFLVISFSQQFGVNLRVVAIVEIVFKLRIQQTSIYIRVILNEKKHMKTKCDPCPPLNQLASVDQMVSECFLSSGLVQSFKFYSFATHSYLSLKTLIYFYRISSYSSSLLNLNSKYVWIE